MRRHLLFLDPWNPSNCFGVFCLHAIVLVVLGLKFEEFVQHQNGALYYNNNLGKNINRFIMLSSLCSDLILPTPLFSISLSKQRYDGC